jgi:hypothetical protein
MRQLLNNPEGIVTMYSIVSTSCLQNKGESRDEVNLVGLNSSRRTFA